MYFCLGPSSTFRSRSPVVANTGNKNIVEIEERYGSSDGSEGKLTVHNLHVQASIVYIIFSESVSLLRRTDFTRSHPERSDCGANASAVFDDDVGLNFATQDPNEGQPGEDTYESRPAQFASEIRVIRGTTEILYTYTLHNVFNLPFIIFLDTVSSLEHEEPGHDTDGSSPEVARLLQMILGKYCVFRASFFRVSVVVRRQVCIRAWRCERACKVVCVIELLR